MNRIYALIDPRTGAVRYIGITQISLKARLTRHIGDALRGSTYAVGNWIRKLVGENRLPLIILIEVTQDRDRERFWISHYRATGLRLLNLTDGGDGGNGLRHTDETRTKMRKPKSAEHRANAAAAIRAVRAEGRYRLLTGDTNPMRLYPERVLRGSANGFATLTEEKVREMRARYARGCVGTPRLARDYGVSQGTAWRIVKGLSWKHVD